MQPERIEKIKKLVQSSALLNSSEKQDWLLLLELMNDKQLLELEKILEPVAPVKMPALIDPMPKFNTGLSFAPNANKTSLAELFKNTKTQNTPIEKQKNNKVLEKQPSIIQTSVKTVPPVKTLSPSLPVVLKPAVIPNQVKPELNENFHHILNLPRMNVSKIQGTLPKVENNKQNPPNALEFLNKLNSSTALPSNTKTGQSSFFKKLKEILSEKELPAPKIPVPPKNKLKPLSGSGISFTSSGKLSTAQIPFGLKPIVSKPLLNLDKRKILEPIKSKINLSNGLAVKQTNLPAAPAKQYPSALAFAPHVKIQTEKKTESPSALPLSSQVAKVNISQLADKLERESLLRKQASAEVGIKVVSNTAEVKAELIQSAKEPQNQKIALSLGSQTGTSLGLGSALRFNSLDELGNFDRKTLNTNSAGFVKSLTGLVKHFGYHKVIFALEKSPVYKSYIETGVSMLLNQSSEQWQDAPQTLSKNEFESFADILTQIQVI